MDIDLGLDKKMKEIEINIEKNMKNKKSKSKTQFLEVIKEEEKETKDIMDTQKGISHHQATLDENKKKDIDILNKINNSNTNKNEININKGKDINKNISNNINNINNNNNHIVNKMEIYQPNENHKDKEKIKEKDSLVMKLLNDPKYANNNRKLAPITKNVSNNQSSTNIINKNYNNNNSNNNNYNYQNIDFLKRGLGVGANANSNKIINFYNEDNIKTRYPTKIILKDEKNYGKLYDINAQSNLPQNSPPNTNMGIISGRRGEKYSAIKRPELNGVVLPRITNNNNNLNVSKTTLSNETNSVYSHLTTGKKFKISHNPGKITYRKPDEVLLLEKECREAIEKAKSEWKFTDKEVEAILVNKIKKKYAKKINSLLHKH